MRISLCRDHWATTANPGAPHVRMYRHAERVAGWLIVGLYD